ncbi:MULTISPECIES: sensor histidine kinase [Streptomycetaceae]|uniref:histidine kinase n=1 Tax=Streptantibioticus cattleyicolor (strain ATCC 35852 / DSM 46488 / JCM 4925 / NBRC 14057 / NRRL 8057) TaxID=1003195 RepID=F8JQR0_STREN|nr:histidine kinase [Streptantibioticus cattleyicolor]AEW92791.1 CinK protein [Streptantibioticus cattleyicolor NRRL 8057 = DSM 46488]MYS57553.1 two-component sensor histidine kinase [Streptomyces sp. SID5468]CCB73145.1 CinK protein [Streptantibioticus cattleyicolor NRRL 8057 = DSM 46488]
MSWREKTRWAAVGRCCLVALLTANSVQNGASVSGGHYLTAGSAVTVLCGAALLTRRLPWAVAPAMTTATVGVWGWPPLPLLLVALFDLAANRRARVALGCAAVALGANLVSRPPTSLWMPQQYGASLFLLLAVVGGLWLGSRHRLVEALAGQVEHLRIERELGEQAARAAERSRIAAEMHDVLAHRLSLIALHTGVLAARGGTLPEPVGERLALLRTASTEALADLRDVLGALRDTDTTPASAVPAPVLRDVDELVEQARDAGQRVHAEVDGRPEQAPAAHRLAVYRIVQEALTNARKHAAGAPVDVRVCYRPPATTVEVANAAGAPAPGAVTSGFGLVGLGERVTALGGRLDAGPAGAGTWRLTARIPHPPEQNGTRT